MRLKDRAFQQVFARLPVYNILWEDSDVDGRFLGVTSDSSILAISAAGCGVAGLLRFRPRSIADNGLGRYYAIWRITV